MITGMHAMIYSTNPSADRIFFRDVLKFDSVDLGDNWLIFKLPPSEIGIHPSDVNNLHELYFICDNIIEFRNKMQLENVITSQIQNERWGDVIRITLPGGGDIGVYQPRHARP
jgi:hypothetical protein